MRLRLVSILLVVAVALPAVSQDEEPKDLGLVERAVSRLAQLDVTVSGPKEIVEQLGPDDFEVVVGGKRIEDFLVDMVCRVEEPAPAPAPGELPDAPVVEAPAPSPPTYMFYVDQPHLTMSGRQGAIEIARRLVGDLIRDGARGMLVSNARDLRTLCPITDDAEELLDALQKLEDDKERQWDPYAALEDNRIEEIASQTIAGHADSLVHRYQAEESWQQAKGLRRLGMVLAQFTEVDPPKAVLYFADTMRSKPGMHYLSLIRPSEGTTQAAELDGDAGVHALDRVINEASAHGIRFYPVEGQGLTTPGEGANNQRVRDAQSTIVSMALETGGKAFLGGASMTKISRQIREDLACVHLISFDPAEFPEDEPLPVRVEVNRPQVKVQTRGRIVIQGESSRLTSRLLSAFALPTATENDIAMRVSLIPTGYLDGEFTALLQIIVPGIRFPEASWDLGASLVNRGKVFDDVSGRIEVRAPGVPVVLEREVAFRSGPYEIVSVAHDTASDQLATMRNEGVWPDLEELPVTVGPMAVLQRSSGVFLRGERVRKASILAHDEDTPVRAEVPTSIIAIVCRSKHQKGSLRVERRLYGETDVPFPVLDLTLGEDRCAPVMDHIPENTLGPGEFRYEVRVVDGDRELTRGERFFLAGP